jgi:hypothetical protein
MIVQTILLYPSGAVWTDDASDLSRLDPSGAYWVDAEHPTRNWKIEGFQSRLGLPTLQVSGMERLLCLLTPLDGVEPVKRTAGNQRTTKAWPLTRPAARGLVVAVVIACILPAFGIYRDRPYGAWSAGFLVRWSASYRGRERTGRGLETAPTARSCGHIRRARR